MNRSFYYILFLCLISVRPMAQDKFDAELFANLTNKDRYAYALKIRAVVEQDSVQMEQYLKQGFSITKKNKDHTTEVLLLIQRFNFLYYVINHPSTPFVRDAILTAINQAEKYDLPIQSVVARMHYREFLFNREKNYEKGYEVLLRAYNDLEEIGFSKIQHYPGGHLSDLLYYPAMDLYHLEDYPNAIKLLQTAYNYPDDGNMFITWHIMNTLGLCYLHNNQPQEAIRYFQKGYDYAKKIDSEIWQGISYGNIGNALMIINRYAEALPYVKKDYEVSKKNKDRESMFNALSNLMLIYFYEKKYKETETTLNEIEEVYQDIHAKNPNPKYFNEFKQIVIFKVKAGLYEVQGNASQALLYNKKYIRLKDSLDKKNDARRYKLIQQRLEAEKYVARVNQLEKEKKAEIWKRNSVISILIIGFIFGLIQYRSIRAKQKQAEIALIDFTKNFKAKSEQADNLQKEIDNLILQGQQVDVLKQLKKKTILTDWDWNEFKILFDKVHPNFINDLYKDNTEITHAEVRLLALSKLNLRDQEMANMLGVSVDAIRKTRYRFKKKSSA